MKTSMMRRRLLAAGMVASSLALSGCFTKDLYEKKDKDYVESVSAFLITEDGKQLVVLGDRYHYIFALPDKLRPVLMSGYRKSLRSSFDRFKVDGSAVTGHYRTVLPPDASAEDRQAAVADGFTEAKNGLAFDGEISGKRYSADGFAQMQKTAAQPFNKPYRVWIHEPLSAFDKGLRLLATPVTVAADGVLVLGGVVLLPFALVAIEAQGGLHIP
ncbi:hypothetical protein [Burkholderia ubonensis]|uniref:5-formyltetrahydrofolate cyclo-ligase n=1 Tax=Burkholderia ubonensis subsp. mesacidophila TaxID=265293 RepID=A0A2A4FIP1_9BURK|nr:hypothetical protein [Burkholderia ubonensis]PCE32552.1 hypothetical protein BZL54_10050 [Burkholderia ubonensis subsp. mesacidophila]